METTSAPDVTDEYIWVYDFDKDMQILVRKSDGKRPGDPVAPVVEEDLTEREEDR